MASHSTVLAFDDMETAEKVPHSLVQAKNHLGADGKLVAEASEKGTPEGNPQRPSKEH